jgi:hypothetical protein
VCAAGHFGSPGSGTGWAQAFDFGRGAITAPRISDCEYLSTPERYLRAFNGSIWLQTPNPAYTVYEASLQVGSQVHRPTFTEDVPIQDVSIQTLSQLVNEAHQTKVKYCTFNISN